jgi:bifunctional non-homologous end joining protein LigD
VAQLSLSLPTSHPRLPRSIAPMRARSGDLPHDGDGWMADPRWGGMRAFALAEPADIRIVDAAGGAIGGADSARDALHGLGPARVVLDGEWLAAADGGPGLYICWDLLWLEGRPLLSRPLNVRRGLLADLRLGTASGPLVAPDALAGDLAGALRAVAREGLNGLLLRRRDSAYLPGVRSRLWRTVLPGSPIAAPEPRRPILAVMQRLPLGEPRT